MPETNFSDFAPRVRKSFSHIPRIIDIPNLLEIQKESFERFLQTGIDMEKRESVGLQAVFNSVFPIRDFNDTASSWATPSNSRSTTSRSASSEA